MKLKIALWSVTIGLMALVFFQNQALFFGQTSLTLNLYFLRFETRAFPLALIVIGFMLSGYSVAMLCYFAERHHSRATIDTLNQLLDRCRVAQVETMDPLSINATAAAPMEPLQPAG